MSKIESKQIKDELDIVYGMIIWMIIYYGESFGNWIDQLGYG